MNRYSNKIYLMLLLLIVTLIWPPQNSWAGESVGQERLAYLELNRIRSISTSNTNFSDYRNALKKAREYVELLQGSDATVVLLRQVMNYFEQALAL